MENYECCESYMGTEYVEFTLGLSLEFQSGTEKYLANLYANVFENKKMGDVKFIVQGQEMVGHIDILANANISGLTRENSSKVRLKLSTSLTWNRQCSANYYDTFTLEELLEYV